MKGFVADQKKLETFDELAKNRKNHFGSMDVLFLNAGLGNFQPVRSTPEDVCDLIKDTNLNGTIYNSRLVDAADVDYIDYHKQEE